MTHRANLVWIGALVAVLLAIVASYWLGVSGKKDSAVLAPHDEAQPEVEIGAPAPDIDFSAPAPDIGSPAPAASEEPRVTSPGPRLDGVESAPDVDALLARMQLGNIAFNAPEALNIRKTATIQLLLSATTALEDLKRELTAPGARMGERIKISDRMEARLTGPEFDITAVTPEIQAVSRQSNTEWKWDIKPKHTGTQALHLTLSALVSVDGETTPRVIRTFDRDIRIEITAMQRAQAFVAGNWQWLWAVVLVPIATWGWKKRTSINVSK